MSLALLFAGQGSQHAQMLPWLTTDHTHAAAASFEWPLDGWRQRLDSHGSGCPNSLAQQVMTLTGIAAWEQLRPLLPQPRVIAGYSVGELAAFCAAGVFDATCAFRLAHRRAQLMDACAQGQPSGLVSVSGAAPGALEQLCHAQGLHVAIRLGPAHGILGGFTARLESALQEADRMGARCVRLQVPLASHTPLMADGVAPLAAILALTPFAAPDVDLIVGTTGQVERAVNDLRSALSRQIAHTVRWDRCMESIQERGITCVLEIGPGNSLSRQWMARYPGIPARSADEFKHPEGVAAWVHAVLRNDSSR